MEVEKSHGFAPALSNGADEKVRYIPPVYADGTRPTQEIRFPELGRNVEWSSSAHGAQGQDPFPRLLLHPDARVQTPMAVLSARGKNKIEKHFTLDKVHVPSGGEPLVHFTNTSELRKQQDGRTSRSYSYRWDC